MEEASQAGGTRHGRQVECSSNQVTWSSATSLITANRWARRVLATALFGDVAFHAHGSAAFDEHCCCFCRPDRVLAGGHRNLCSRGITDCLVTAITITRCGGRDGTGGRYR